MGLKTTGFALYLCVAIAQSNAFAQYDKRHQSGHEERMTDQQRIQHVMRGQFDRPASPLSIPVVTVESEYAIASWVQDGKGGRALLKKSGGNWSIHLCGGDGLRNPSTLVMAGLEKSTAARLLEKLATAERNLPVAQVKQFSMFQGVVKIDDPRHGGHSSSTRHDEQRR